MIQENHARQQRFEILRLALSLSLNPHTEYIPLIEIRQQRRLMSMNIIIHKNEIKAYCTSEKANIDYKYVLPISHSNHIEQGWRTTGTRAIDGTRHNILGIPPIKMVCILIQNNKVQYEATNKRE
ncbi:hypothetical protein TNCV_2040551 [Trichonephila clavipes]|nr:hypothetical protein TNCV_2040551 [Trichonephila clavipes]